MNFKPTVLPAIESAATIVRGSTQEAIHESFAEVGTWLEENNYMLCGSYREVLLELGSSPEEVIFENQFPIKKIPFKQINSRFYVLNSLANT